MCYNLICNEGQTTTTYLYKGDVVRTGISYSYYLLGITAEALFKLFLYVVCYTSSQILMNINYLSLVNDAFDLNEHLLVGAIYQAVGLQTRLDRFIGSK